MRAAICQSFRLLQIYQLSDTALNSLGRSDILSQGVRTSSYVLEVGHQVLTAFYSTKKKKINKNTQEQWVNLLFSSGNTFEDYLRILQSVPAKGAAAYMRGQWGVQGRGTELGKGDFRAVWRAARVIHSGFSGK